jgi:hypothetical protein
MLTIGAGLIALALVLPIVERDLPLTGPVLVVLALPLVALGAAIRVPHVAISHAVFPASFLPAIIHMPGLFAGPAWSGMGSDQRVSMVDPSSGVTVTGSDIVEYLFVTYGNPIKIPMMLKSNAVSDLTLRLAMSLRTGKGATFSGTPDRRPQKPLVFWAYEASPFCAVVREVLSELAIPYMLVNCARGSPKRNVLFSTYGHFQAPCLVDENAGVAMFESAAIIEYLKKTYQ